MERRDILLVDNAEMVDKEKLMLETSLGLSVSVASTYKEAKELLSKKDDFFAAILGVSLIDAPHGEIVDLVSGRIPSIALSQKKDEDLSLQIIEKGVLDCYTKQTPGDFAKVIEEIRGLDRNRDSTIMIIESSSAVRKLTSKTLRRFNFKTVEIGMPDIKIDTVAKMLEKDPSIKLVIIGTCPALDGFALARAIRESKGKDELAIIGLSSNNSTATTTKFLRSGASDFLSRPFEEEELYVRVAQNIELLEKIDKIRSLSNRDFLTGIYNRRYFFDAGEKIYKNVKRAKQSIAVAMLDIDHFKNINDTYGHHIGDKVIVAIAKALNDRFRTSDLVARLGGEEFCVVAPGMATENVLGIFDETRKAIQEIAINGDDGEEIKATISIGVATTAQDTLDDILKVADAMLYKAKKGGRNRVEIF